MEACKVCGRPKWTPSRGGCQRGQGASADAECASYRGGVTRDHSKGSAAIERANYIEVPEEVSVYSWSPAPEGTPNARSTQVHVHLGRPPGNVVLIRFKSPRSIDALIDALRLHRDDVWGKR